MSIRVKKWWHLSESSEVNFTSACKKGHMAQLLVKYVQLFILIKPSFIYISVAWWPSAVSMCLSVLYSSQVSWEKRRQHKTNWTQERKDIRQTCLNYGSYSLWGAEGQFIHFKTDNLFKQHTDDVRHNLKAYMYVQKALLQSCGVTPH